MTRDHMLAHAAEWIAAWNRRDLETVLRPFADNARFISPRAAAVVGHPVVEGKSALREYWTKALGRIGAMEFRLDRVVCDVERREMVVVYERLLGGETTRACEIMRFDGNGRQVEGEALYGAAS